VSLPRFARRAPRKTAVGGRARWWLGCAAIVVASFAVYAPALGGDFVFDDDIHLTENPVLEEGGLRRIWLTPPENLNYWPVTWTSYWIEHRLWGLDPVGYHLANVLIHAAGVCLIWAVLRRLGVPYPWLVALVFALHPVNVASVAWIAQQKNVLSLFFFALSLLLYLRFEQRRAAGSYLLALASYLAAMLSKGAAAPLPAVLLLCAWWQRGSLRRRDLWAVIPFFFVAALTSLIEIASQSLVIASDVVREDDLPARIAGAGWVVWFYLFKAVLPLGLSFFYPRWQIDAADPLAWIPLLAFAALLAAAWLRRGSWGRPVLFALLYFVLMLAPVLGFLDIYFMRFSYVADHYQYLALVGIVALLVGGLGSLLARYVSRAALVGAAALVVGFCAVGSAVQSATYRDAEVLYRSTIAKNPDAFAAHYNLAHRLQAEGRLEEAAHHYRETLRIRPDDARASNNLGKVLEDQGQPLLAIGYYRRALEIDPESLEAHNNLALMLQTQGQPEDAILHFRTALRIAPDAAAVHYNLARLLEQLGRLDQSIAHYRGALEADPRAEHARAGLARALAARARREHGKSRLRSGA
jgi:tetratricopeptide (TPR) repeat protein